MKTFAYLLVFALLLTASLRLSAQESPKPQPQPAPEIQFKVEASRTVPAQNGARLIIQRVAPPILPPAPVVAPAPAPDPEALAAWRAKRKAEAPLGYRLLSLSVVNYGLGFSLLSWGHFRNGKYEAFEAWTRTDFRSLNLVQDFDVNRIRILVCPLFYKQGTWSKQLRLLPQPEAFLANGPGFILVKGDPNNLDAINPITALHKIYREEGEQLQAQWEEVLRARAAAEELERQKPPVPPQDTIIRIWPIKSQRYSTEPAAPEASNK